MKQRINTSDIFKYLHQKLLCIIFQKVYFKALKIEGQLLTI